MMGRPVSIKPKKKKKKIVEPQMNEDPLMC